MDELDKTITAAMEKAISENKVFHLEENRPEASEVWWDDTIVSRKTVWNPAGLGGKFSMEEALLGISIITKNHHIFGIEAHIGSLLFEFVVRTVRVPGRVNELLFTTDNCTSLQPKPRFEGYAPVNLAAIVHQSTNPEITDNELREIIKESAPNITEDNIEICLQHCRSLREFVFIAPDDKWAQLLRKTQSDGREDIGIAFLGFIGLTMLSTIAKEAGSGTFGLRDSTVAAFRSWYEAGSELSDVCIYSSVAEKLYTYFDTVKSSQLLALYSCLSVFHSDSWKSSKSSVQRMLNNCLLKHCAFKGLELVNFFNHTVEVYETDVGELSQTLWGGITKKSLSNILRALIQYSYTTEKKKQLVDEDKIKIPPSLTNQTPSTYWQFARYFDREVLPQFTPRASPILALTLVMMIDERDWRWLFTGRRMSLYGLGFPPLDDDDIRLASHLADWTIFRLSTRKSPAVVLDSDSAYSEALKTAKPPSMLKPTAESLVENYKLRKDMIYDF